MTTLHEYRTTPACAVESPGYGDLWDQYLVKDITINGPGTLTFSYATDMDIQIADDGSEVPQNGCLFDQLDVYVGLSTVAVPHGSSIPATADISDLVAITDTLIANLRGRSGVRTVTTGAFCDVVTGPITGYPNPNRSFQTGLRQNVPNPFRPAMQTYIAYSVGRKAWPA